MNKNKDSNSNLNITRLIKILFLNIFILSFGLLYIYFDLFTTDLNKEVLRKSNNISFVNKELSNSNIINNNQSYSTKNITKLKSLNNVSKRIFPINKTKDLIVFSSQPKSYRPKLVLIIDDVVTQSEINSIKEIEENITISILPPTYNNKSSIYMSEQIPNYMVHLPLEALNYRFEEESTLYVNDSYSFIDNRIKQIRKWYPSAKYINNHTGSKFTSNNKAMNNLLKALKKYDFSFLDSLTTSSSVAKKYALKYDINFFSRDVFLDNIQEYDYILKQLKKVIKLSKIRGYAIGIGHPKKMTLKVLRNESKKLFKDIDIVYLDHLKKK
jgi:uncharacterized protein